MRNLLLLAVLLLAACSSAPITSPGPSGGQGTPAPTGSPTPAPTDPQAPAPTDPQTPAPTGSAGEWRVLASELWLPEAPFAVRIAFDAATYEALWSELGQRAGLPAVAFEREAVIYLGISGSSSCPEQLETLAVDHQAGRVHGVWRVEQGRPCTDDLAPQGVLLAVDRAVLPSQPFLLSLRETPICADCPDHPDQLLVDPAAPADG